ncbi:MAG: PD-(D/E)XK nuclease-like domain-containing protein [Thermoguttaceae bacterium]|nr:PD-(D/E)XK nuclease-like domain-containing protein [Thermoguttaceae bacterium]
MEPFSFAGFEKPRELAFDWNVSTEEYRADERLNFHKLLDFRRDPRAFRDGYFENKEETDAMRFGTALHALILRGREAFDAEIAAFDPPINPKTGEPFGAATNAFKDARAAFESANAGKTLITKAERDLIEKMRDEANFHPVAPRVLGRADWAKSEVPVRGEINLGDGTTYPVKGMIDRYSENGLIELKTTAQFDDASGRDKFRYIVYDYKYIVQLAFYHCILTDVLGAPFVPVWIVAFEKNQPNRVAVYAISAQVITDARVVAKEWVKSYKESLENNSYPSRYDLIQTISEYKAERDL